MYMTQVHIHRRAYTTYVVRIWLVQREQADDQDVRNDDAEDHKKCIKGALLRIRGRACRFHSMRSCNRRVLLTILHSFHSGQLDLFGNVSSRHGEMFEQVLASVAC